MSIDGENVLMNQNVLGPGIRLTEQELPDPSSDEGLASAVPVFIGWAGGVSETGVMYRLFSPTDFPEEASKWPDCLRDCLTHYFDNGGSPCWVYVGHTPQGNDFSAGWTAFVNTARAALLGYASLTLVAVPQLVREVVSTEEKAIASTLVSAWKILLSAFASRPDLFFVLDAPSQTTATTACIQAWRNDASLSALGQRAALYGPQLVTDYRNSKNSVPADTRVADGFRVLPPSAAVMGVYARTDAAYGVWKAPANDTLAHVVRPEFRETSAVDWFSDDRASVNLIRSFAGRGTRVWGCRTLAGDGVALHRYVQVRRTLSWIEANLKEVCRFAVFEPNSLITWYQLQGLCRAWLRRLWLEGGLAGADEASAFSIRVGLGESMTADDITAGNLVVDVAVALLTPAEFINVTLVLQVGNQQVSQTTVSGDPLS